MSADPPAPIVLALSEDPLGPAVPGPWVGPLVALGARIARYSRQVSDRQLIVTISVPARDFAAALISTGWAMERPAPKLEAPLGVMRRLEPRTPVRMVTEREVLADFFSELNEQFTPPRVHLAGSRWQADKVKALAILPDLGSPERQARPTPGSISALAGLTETWDERLCCPAADLAVVGTLAWLRDDLGAFLQRDSDALQHPDRIASLLLPAGDHVATWSTRLYASAGFSDMLPLPTDVKAVVLDGAGAIKYVGEIESPVVVAILDRSVADETAAEIVLQLRNTRGETVSVRDDLHWPPPSGIEALAFTVPL